MKRNLTPRERWIFLICCLLSVVFVIYNFGWKTLNDRAVQLDGAIEAKIARLKKHRQILREADAYQSRYEGYQKMLIQDGSDDAVGSRLLSEIESVSVEAGLKISDLKPLRVREETYYRVFPVNVSIDGNIVTILDFIDRLQKEPYRFDVLDLRIDQGQRRGTEVKAALVMSKIFFKEPSAEKKPKAKARRP